MASRPCAFGWAVTLALLTQASGAIVFPAPDVVASPSLGGGSPASLFASRAIADGGRATSWTPPQPGPSVDSTRSQPIPEAQDWSPGEILEEGGLHMQMAASMFTDRNRNGIADGEEIVADPSKDLDQDWSLDSCETAEVTLIADHVRICPGGDLDRLGLILDYNGVQPAPRREDSSIQLIRDTTSEAGLSLWERRGGGWARTDTLHFEGVRVIGRDTLWTAGVTGCGVLHANLWVGGRLAAYDLYVHVLGLDQSLDAIGAVDDCDLRTWTAREASRTNRPPLHHDADRISWEAGLDSLLRVHRGHSWPRHLIEPDGGQRLVAGQRVRVRWEPGVGTASRVRVFLIRPGAEYRLADGLPDDGSTIVTIPSSLPVSGDYRMRVEHTAGVLETVGRDDSDGRIRVSSRR